MYIIGLLYTVLYTPFYGSFYGYLQTLWPYLDVLASLSIRVFNFENCRRWYLFQRDF